MSRLVMIKKNQIQRRIRTRRRIRGTSDQPRLSVFISLKHIYAQVIDDDKGITLASVSSLKLKPQSRLKMAQELGIAIANECKKVKIEKVVLDRGSKIYHGKLEVFAEAARKQGLKF